jgi:hypothetical protein
MKSILLAILFFTVALPAFSLTVSQRVRHTTDAPATASGCSQVKLKVIYSTGGAYNGIAFSSTVSINSGSYYDFSVVIPDGATIVSKTVEFSFAGGNNYNYVITGTNNTVSTVFANCSCPTVSSRYLFLTETTGKGAELQFYHTDVVSSGC